MSDSRREAQEPKWFRDDFERWYRESAGWTGADFLWVNRFRELYRALAAVGVSDSPDEEREDLVSALARALGALRRIYIWTAPSTLEKDEDTAADAIRQVRSIIEENVNDLARVYEAHAREARLPNPAENSPAGVGEARPAEPPTDECHRCGMPGHLCECDSVGAPATERPDARDWWECEGCHFTNGNGARECLGCGEPKSTALLSRSGALADLEAARAANAALTKELEAAGRLREQLDAATKALKEIASASVNGADDGWELQAIARAVLGVVGPPAEDSVSAPTENVGRAPDGGAEAC